MSTNKHFKIHSSRNYKPQKENWGAGQMDWAKLNTLKSYWKDGLRHKVCTWRYRVIKMFSGQDVQWCKGRLKTTESQHRPILSEKNTALVIYFNALRQQRQKERDEFNTAAKHILEMDGWVFKVWDTDTKEWRVWSSTNKNYLLSINHSHRNGRSGSGSGSFF